MPPKQWNKWPQRAKVVFNNLYRLLRDNQTIFTHPKADEIPDKHWSTIAWNASWEAADAAANEPVLAAGVIVKDIRNGKKAVREHVVPTLKKLLFNDTDNYRGHTLRVLAT